MFLASNIIGISGYSKNKFPVIPVFSNKGTDTALNHIMSLTDGPSIKRKIERSICGKQLRK